MLSSLPSRPLRLTEIDALDHSDAMVFCRPLVAFRTETPTDDVIAFYLATESETRLVGYGGETGWIILETLEQSAETDSLERAADAVIDWAEATHGSDSVIVISVQDTDDGLERLLPEHPIGKGDLSTIETLPGIAAVHPMFCYAESHEIIAFLSFQVDPTAPDAVIMANYAYHPRDQSWTQIERAIIAGDQDVNPAEDVTIHEWIERQYDMADLLAISPDPGP